MRYSKAFGKTSKNEGTDLSVKSHRLLVQAGYIRESTAGRYYLLPLGIKVQHKIIAIIKKHMDQAGAQQLVTPTLHPLELWQETNRDNAAGYELTYVTDRRGAKFALGGTAEEMIVDLVRKFNISYKDLPFNVYQFSLKFRDEMRARGGLLRVREFTMKDAYSFGNEEQFEETYQTMRQTYTDIFKELGLETAVAEADSGYIGGEYCHEFIADAEVGESTYYTDGEYVAHEDVAVFELEPLNLEEPEAELKEVDAERGTTMQDGAAMHNLPMWQQIKDVMYVDEANNRYILAVIRGDFEVNETKLMRGLGLHNLRLANEEEIRDDIGSEPGFISPVKISKTTKSGRQLIVVGDPSLKTVKNAYGGANSKNRDLLNINFGRDYQLDQEFDIAMAQAGFKAKSGKPLEMRKGVEVGNIFQLGYHYSNLMKNAEFTNQQGFRQKYYMGCYGIGVERTLATIAEVYADEHGLVWPANVAPYEVYLVSIGDIQDRADDVYEQLTKAGIDVLYDDRDVRPGEKMADADLLGIPIRLVISPRSLESDQVEVKLRTSAESELVELKSLIKHIHQLLSK
ncbi:proline--tRNA ligase [Candidatus Saccharibacteria bacterium]|nr:proline--tRNA ligase [Candidatus Saccharibacteria bacterium]MCB9821333.1 proline--tRNA ligase [Candidatus Nomurabacteria bacterium]